MLTRAPEKFGACPSSCCAESRLVMESGTSCYPATAAVTVGVGADGLGGVTAGEGQGLPMSGQCRTEAGGVP